MEPVKSCICWVGGKSKLLWLLHKLFPMRAERFIDVFGGSGTVLLSRPVVAGTLEVYNDFNGDLVNLFHCVKNKTLALVKELGFLPLNSRDDFNSLCRFLAEEALDDDLQEELALAEHLFDPPHADEIKRMLLEKASCGDVKRAAAYYKLIRYSFSSNTKTFGGKPCDLRRFFSDIWSCSRRLADVVIENKDCVDLVRQYDRPDALIYCDPPYYEAERLYAVEFGEADHIRLHHALAGCKGYVMVSYNRCDFILDLYKDFYIFYTTRPNSMSSIAGSEYHELVMTNYDPRASPREQMSLFGEGDCADEGRYELIHEPHRPLKSADSVA